MVSFLWFYQIKCVENLILKLLKFVFGWGLRRFDLLHPQRRCPLYPHWGGHPYPFYKYGTPTCHTLGPALFTTVKTMSLVMMIL